MKAIVKDKNLIHFSALTVIWLFSVLGLRVDDTVYIYLQAGYLYSVLNFTERKYALIAGYVLSTLLTSLVFAYSDTQHLSTFINASCLPLVHAFLLYWAMLRVKAHRDLNDLSVRSIIYVLIGSIFVSSIIASSLALISLTEAPTIKEFFIAIFPTIQALTWGVLLTYPLALVLDKDEDKSSNKVVIVVACFMAAMLLSRSLQQNAVLFETEKKARLAENVNRIGGYFSEYLNKISIFQNAIGLLIAQDPELDQQKFAKAVKAFPELKGDLLVTEWLPVIKSEHRKEYESEMRRFHGKGFSILDLGSDGQHQRAQNRAAYYPVTFIYPPWINKSSLGFDPSSTLFSSEAIIDAIESDSAKARAPLQLTLFDRSKLPVMSIFKAVYDYEAANLLHGLVLVVIKVEHLVQRALTSSDIGDLEVNIKDNKTGQYYLSTEISELPIYSLPLELFGRTLSMEFYSTKLSQTQNKVYSLSLSLALKAFAIYLILELLLVLSMRKSLFEKLLLTKTNELKLITKSAIASERAANDALRQSIHAQEDLKLSNMAFDSANEAMLIITQHGVVKRSNCAYKNLLTEQQTDADTLPIFTDNNGEIDEFGSGIWEIAKTEGSWRGERIFTCVETKKPVMLSISFLNNKSRNHFVIVFLDISETKQAQHELLRKANYDLLTGLPNRSFFNDRLSQHISFSKRNNLIVCLMFIDLDKFKLINDTLGHDAGDHYLVHIADSLKRCVRDSDTVARLGGDEFTVIFDDVKSESDIPLLAEKVLTAIRTPITLNGSTIAPDASIGISLYPTHTDSSSELTKFADRAMYQAKHSRSDSYTVYSHQLDNYWKSRELLKEEIKKAMDNAELDVYFQPFNDSTANKHLYAYEALLRWNHPSKGIIKAGDFISSIVDIHTITDIDLVVLNKVVEYLKSLSRAGINIECSVNLSIHTLMSEQLMTFVKNEHHVLCEQHQLLIEVNEAQINIANHQAIQSINELRAMGVMIVIDDFGSSHTALSLLNRIDVDLIKIDRHISNNAEEHQNSRAILSALVSLCHEMDIIVVVQEVESQKDIQFLSSLGIHCFQGYALSRPLDINELINFMTDQ